MYLLVGKKDVRVLWPYLLYKSETHFGSRVNHRVSRRTSFSSVLAVQQNGNVRSENKLNALHLGTVAPCFILGGARVLISACRMLSSDAAVPSGQKVHRNRDNYGKEQTDTPGRHLGV